MPRHYSRLAPASVAPGANGELDGSLVCADEGLRKWADKVGIEIVHPLHRRRILDKLPERRSARPADE